MGQIFEVESLLALVLQLTLFLQEFVVDVAVCLSRYHHVKRH